MVVFFLLLSGFVCALFALGWCARGENGRESIDADAARSLALVVSVLNRRRLDARAAGRMHSDALHSQRIARPRRLTI